MKVLYAYQNNDKPIYVSGLNPNYLDNDDLPAVVVFMLLKVELDYFVYYVDNILRTAYIARIKNILSSDVYNIDNFERVQSDEQFKALDTFIQKQFNYSGQHLGEKLDGETVGGPIVWIP